MVALSRFGTFIGLGQTASSPSDAYPALATLTFPGASYTRPYLSFTGKEIHGKEIQGSEVVNGTYATLDTLTSAIPGWVIEQARRDFVHRLRR